MPNPSHTTRCSATAVHGYAFAWQRFAVATLRSAWTLRYNASPRLRFGMPRLAVAMPYAAITSHCLALPMRDIAALCHRHTSQSYAVALQCHCYGNFLPKHPTGTIVAADR